MSYRLRLASAVAGLALATAPVTLAAQSAEDSPNATVYARAQELVGSGEGDAGRAVVDSMLAAARAGTPEYAEALFWRAAFARTAAEAERDYLRVSVEYPASPYAEDALLRLGMLELSRGDRRQALRRFESLVLRYPTGRQRPRAQYWIGRTYFDDNRVAEGCTALAAARGATPADAVELRTQIDYYAQRCRTVQAAPSSQVAGVAQAPVADAGAPTTGTPSAGTAAAGTAAAGGTTSGTPAPASASAVTYSVQVGAFPARESAERLARQLRERGHDARVDGDAAPFRVRIGRYGTREMAAQRLAELRQRGMDGFVAEVQGR